MNLKDSIYWKLFSDIWGMMKRFLPVRDDEAYWSEAVALADDLYKKYKGTPQEEFAKELILDVMDELESIYKRKDTEFIARG